MTYAPVEYPKWVERKGRDGKPERKIVESHNEEEAWKSEFEKPAVEAKEVVHKDVSPAPVVPLGKK